MKGAIEAIAKCITFNSENAKEIETNPKINRRLICKASSIPKSRFTRINKTKVKYESDDSEFFLNFKKEPSCQCYSFLKKAICVHLVSYSYLNELNWYGSKVNKAIDNQRNFIPKIKRGAKSGAYRKAEKALVKK